MVFWIKTLGFIFLGLILLFWSRLFIFWQKLFFVFPSRRKETLISNLRYAFPEWSNSKIRRVARISTERMLEMGFFSLTYPIYAEKKDGEICLYSTEIEQKLIKLKNLMLRFCFYSPLFTF